MTRPEAPSAASSDRSETYRCRAGIDGTRCDFRGDRAELSEHADEAGHPRCIVGAEVLSEYERQTCDRCANRVRDDLAAVVDAVADLERRIREGAYSGGWLTPLAMVSDGNVAGLKPWREFPEKDVVEVERPGLPVGQDVAGQPVEHPSYVERRIPPTGREHFEDHWRNDPVSVLAALESAERDWRHEFGHGPADDLATVPRCAEYLRAWLTLAARTHPAFDEFAAELQALRASVENAAGLAEHPKKAPIPCVCGGKLEQRYGDRGLSDDRVCRACGTTYPPNAYWWRHRMFTETDGWVSPERAAAETDRPVTTVKAWMYDPEVDVPFACHRLSKRLVVDLAAVVEQSERTPRQQRRRTGEVA